MILLLLFIIYTRYKIWFVLPKTRLQQVSNSIYGQGIRFYNRIPENIQKAPITKLKKNVKERLFLKGKSCEWCDRLRDISKYKL